MSAGSWFYAYGAANENDLEPNVVRMMFAACRKHPCALSADEIGRQVETHAPSCQIRLCTLHDISCDSDWVFTGR